MAEASIEDFVQYEALYAEQPKAYKRKVLGFIFLGYVYIALTILLIAGFTIGGILLFATGTLKLMFVDEFLQVGVPLVIVAGLMARAVFVRIPRPEGVYLQGELKQKLLKAFDGVRESAGGQSIDEVVIDSRMNAAVQQVPRFGLFGPATNYLIIGAPLLSLMTVEETRAVIAHEFGHLSHEHGRLGSLVYRLDQTLYAAAQAIDEKARSGFKGASFRFLDWFYNRFSVLTFAMRRAQEYEADTVSAQANGAAALSSSLCKLYALDAPLDRYWSDVWRHARRASGNDQVQPFSAMNGTEILGPAGLDGTAAIDLALQRKTDFSDSHPCLRDRLSALQVAPVTSFGTTRFALDEILGPEDKAELLDLVDDQWRQASSEHWRQVNADYVATEDEMATLQKQAANLPAEDLFRLAQLEESLRGDDVARKRYRQLVDALPENAGAQFHWGRITLDSEFSLAETALLKSAELDLELVPNVESLLRPVYEQGSGNTAALDGLVERYRQKTDAASQERAEISLDDELKPVAVESERLESIARWLKEKFPEIQCAYAVQKRLEHFSDEPAILLAFVIDRYHDNVEVDEDKWLSRAVDSISREFPELYSSYSLILEKKGLWLERLSAVGGARFYVQNTSFLGRSWGFIKFVYSLLAGIALIVVGIYFAYQWLTGD